MELKKVKDFLRVEHDAEDELIEGFITAAEEYVRSSCGADTDFTQKRVETVIFMLVSDMYEQRTAGGKGSYSRSIASMLTQLRIESDESK